MITVFFAIYDDGLTNFHDKIFYKSQKVVYRTNNKKLFDELTGQGIVVTAILSQKDVENLKNGAFSCENGDTVGEIGRAHV